MKKTFLFFIFISFQSIFAQFDFERNWGTYIGNAGQTILSHESDSQGNIILASRGLNFSTPNSFQTTVGTCNIVKINSYGNIVWATYINAEITDLKVDSRNDDIVVIGFAQTNSSNLVNPNAYEMVYESSSMILAKFDSSGTKIWGTYYNVGDDNVTIGSTQPSIEIDQLGAIYFSHRAGYSTLGTSGTFQNQKNGLNPYAISKFSSSGVKVWTTYYGVNGSSIQELSINSNGLFVTGRVKDCPPAYNNPNTYFATSSAYQPTALGSCNTNYLSKFNFDGQRLWSTYFKNLGAVEASESSVYITSQFPNPNLITAGTFQQNSDASSMFFGKFDDFGQPIWGTYVGLNATLGTVPTFIGAAGIETDPSDNVYLFGGTKCATNIATVDAFLSVNPSLNYGTGFCMKFDQNGQRLWGTYYGGNQQTSISSMRVNANNFYINGITTCENSIATNGSLQANYLASDPSLVPNNSFLIHFRQSELNSIDTNLKSISIIPNPNIGNFIISSLDAKSDLIIYDLSGQKIHEQQVNNDEFINLKFIAKGIYFATIKTNKIVYKTVKLVIK